MIDRAQHPEVSVIPSINRKALSRRKEARNCGEQFGRAIGVGKPRHKAPLLPRKSSISNNQTLAQDLKEPSGLYNQPSCRKQSL